MEVKIKKLRADAILPRYATDGSGCFDLFVPTDEQRRLIDEGEAATLPTGLAFEIPEDHVMLVFSRSGHGFKNNVRLSNSVGVVDSDYRGEVGVKLIKDYERRCDPYEKFEINPGDRIAQALIIPVPRVTFIEVDELGETERGEGGFGSTGS